MQIYLHNHNTWADVTSECAGPCVAKSLDGVMTYVLKDGTQIIRNGETE